ncbi:uncharacterized protein C2845_PM16G03130 [Panicum miliaceum]|uniref:Uncharacterized protein n=1 Tax=Panicum miliaceum TaxID=4540 RepID=A0A3L6Q257_PANMI|nr:uncharacterized protein C2845_PM16G03130 [Panicum miliaceum]
MRNPSVPHDYVKVDYMKRGMIVKARKEREKNPFNIRKGRSIEYRFQTKFHQDFYESAILSKKYKVACSKYVDWQKFEDMEDPIFDEIIDACKNKDVYNIMGFKYNWNNEIIAQFYATFYFEEDGDVRWVHWMTEGKWYKINYFEFAAMFGFDKSDYGHNKIHIGSHLPKEDMTDIASYANPTYVDPSNAPMPQQPPYDPNFTSAEGLGSWLFGHHLGAHGQGTSGYGGRNDDGDDGKPGTFGFPNPAVPDLSVMVRTRETARKSTCGPRQIQHPQEVLAQEEPVQPEDAPVVMEIDDNDDDDYYGYYGGGWVDTNTEEEPMELPEDHQDVVEDSDEEDASGGDGADPGAIGGDDAEDGGDDLGAPDGDDDDPDDDPEPAAAADVPPPEPHYEKELHHLDFAEEIQEIKRKLRKTLREKAIPEAQLRGDQVIPPEYDSDESIDYLPKSPPRKCIHYGETGYCTHYR